MHLLVEEDVIYIHDQVQNPSELQGLVVDKSLVVVLDRVEYRLTYRLIKDEFNLAAAYAVVISTGHLLNDGNKRTAFRCMGAVLQTHGTDIQWNTESADYKICDVAQGKVDEIDLAVWMRCLC